MTPAPGGGRCCPSVCAGGVGLERVTKRWSNLNSMLGEDRLFCIQWYVLLQKVAKIHINIIYNIYSTNLLLKYLCIPSWFAWVLFFLSTRLHHNQLCLISNVVSPCKIHRCWLLLYCGSRAKKQWTRVGIMSGWLMSLVFRKYPTENIWGLPSGLHPKPLPKTCD